MTKTAQTHTSSWNQDISIWLSVDPLSDKYPGWSPYNYCLNNPLKYIDPDGRTPEERNAAINQIRTYIGTPYSKIDCSELVDRAIRNSTDLGSLKRGKGINGFNNGVALIVSNSRNVELNDIELGNLATFKSGRLDHKGVDGEYDHIGMITNVLRNEDGSVKSFDFIHSSGKGVKEDTYNIDTGLAGFELKGTFAWDTPKEKNYFGKNLPEFLIVGQKIEGTLTKLKPLPPINIKIPVISKVEIE